MSPLSWPWPALNRDMTLDELISPIQGRLKVLERIGDQRVTITSLTDDSRNVEPGSLFVAVKGERVDGHAFSDPVVAAGAAAVVMEQRVPGGIDPFRSGARLALGLGDPRQPVLSRSFGGVADDRRDGHQWKNDDDLYREGHARSGGPAGWPHRDGRAILSGRSRFRPHIRRRALWSCSACLRGWSEAGLDTVVMEVSSHALALNRTAGSEFDVAVFTNLTQDHLDFHVDMERYFQAKLKLFVELEQPGTTKPNKRAIINIDDPWGARFREACTAPAWTYGLRHEADLCAEEVTLSGSRHFLYPAQPSRELCHSEPFGGGAQCLQPLAAIGVVLHEGLTLDQVRSAVGDGSNVPGRFERVEAGQDFTVVVDYAHTEDALVRLLTAAQALNTGRIITVLGAAAIEIVASAQRWASRRAVQRCRGTDLRQSANRRSRCHPARGRGRSEGSARERSPCPVPHDCLIVALPLRRRFGGETPETWC